MGRRRQLSANVHGSVSNATGVNQLCGKAHNVNVSLGSIWDASFTFRWSGKGSWVFTPSLGPGIGASVSSYDTDTFPVRN